MLPIAAGLAIVACIVVARHQVEYWRNSRALWAHALDANQKPIEPAGSALADAVEAVGVAARAASLRLGPRPAWSWASVLTVGALLANTNTPWLAP